MKTFRLSLITENQKTTVKAERVAALVQQELEIAAAPEITKYYKFPDSYRIEFSGQFSSDSGFIAVAVDLTDRLASPWLLSYDRTEEDISMIFNKTDSSRFRRQEFNVICWGNLETD